MTLKYSTFPGKRFLLVNQRYQQCLGAVEVLKYSTIVFGTVMKFVLGFWPLSFVDICTEIELKTTKTVKANCYVIISIFFLAQMGVVFSHRIEWYCDRFLVIDTSANIEEWTCRAKLMNMYILRSHQHTSTFDRILTCQHCVSTCCPTLKNRLYLFRVITYDN